MKVKVLKPFIDGPTNVFHTQDKVVEFEEKRAKHLADLGFIEIEEVDGKIEEQEKKLAPKKRAKKA